MRCTAIRIPTSDPQHHFLVEARLRADAYDALIPGKGDAVYEVEEAVWAPLHLRTVPPLGVSQSYVSPSYRDLTVSVNAAVPGGFTVQVQVPENLKCPALRAEFDAIQTEIQDLESIIGDLPPKETRSHLAEDPCAQGTAHEPECPAPSARLLAWLAVLTGHSALAADPVTWW